MEPNLVFFQVMKPAGMKDAAGNDQYAVYAMTQDMSQALGVMMQTPGAVVTCVVCIAKNPNGGLITPGNPGTKLNG
jgi:hypothetical protein